MTARLGCVLALTFALLWALSPVAALVLPLVAQGAGAGLAACLGSVGVGAAVGLGLIGAGLAVRVARPAVPRGALLYGPSEPALPPAEIIEGEYRYD